MDENTLCLSNGSFYEGEQTTSNGSFKIDMKINKFDLKRSFVCGTFKIHNLTKQHELLTTYFEGDIMGSDHLFSDNLEDEPHWARFPKWKKDFTIDSKLYDQKKSPYLYFRIKEHFLLPDPKITTIPGASIDGYYYCCYYKRLDCFTGFYHYRNSNIRNAQNIVLVRGEMEFSQSYDFA